MFGYEENSKTFNNIFGVKKNSEKIKKKKKKKYREINIKNLNGLKITFKVTERIEADNRSKINSWYDLQGGSSIGSGGQSNVLAEIVFEIRVNEELNEINLFKRKFEINEDEEQEWKSYRKKIGSGYYSFINNHEFENLYKYNMDEFLREVFGINKKLSKINPKKFWDIIMDRKNREFYISRDQLKSGKLNISN